MDKQHSPVKALQEQDSQNFDTVWRMLGPVVTLPDDVARLYELHYAALAPKLSDLTARFAGSLYVLCRKHFFLGATSLLRLYASQMFRETRAAVETAGIAHAICTDVDSFRAFTEDDGRKEARARAKKCFTSQRLFPSDKPRLSKLGAIYREASTLSHTNRLSFVRHVHKTDDPAQLGLSFCDIPLKLLPRLLPNHLIWLCHVHISILFAADDVFASLRADLDPFNRERRYVYEKLRRFSDQNEGKLV